MLGADISLWNNNHFKVVVYEIEEGVSFIPIPVYEFIVKGDMLKSMPSLFAELGVDFVDYVRCKQKGYLANYIFACKVFAPNQRDSDLVQARFW